MNLRFKKIWYKDSQKKMINYDINLGLDLMKINIKLLQNIWINEYLNLLSTLILFLIFNRTKFSTRYMRWYNLLFYLLNHTVIILTYSDT